MRRFLSMAGRSLLLLPGLCLAQELTPAEALDRYLAAAGEQRPECSDLAFAVQIDASLPKLKKKGSMSGFKLILPTGQIVYRGLKFTGDSIVKTAVIARFLAQETDPPEAAGDTGLNPRNYTFLYDRTTGWNGGAAAYAFRVKPKRKRTGLFRGEIWLDTSTARALRVSGDLVKSPSIFVRSFHFVQDYEAQNRCGEPARLVLTVRTRLAGQAEMAVSLHSVDRPAESNAAGAGASDGVANLTSAHP